MAQIIHQDQPVMRRGASLDQAKAAMIMIHRRGGDANGIMQLSNHFDQDDFAYLAPSAAAGSWYPNRFIAPRESNQPYLASALETLQNLLQEVADAGIPPEKTMILGFSQGACLASETAARYPQQYGGIVALSGGLIGAEGELVGYDGSLTNTPVFLGCSDVDFHIPVDRVHETRDIFTQLGATVDERIYKDMGHTIIDDEVQAIKQMMQALV